MLENIKNMAIDHLMKSKLSTSIKKSFDAFEKVQETLYTLVDSKENDTTVKLRIGTVLTFAVINKVLQGKSPNNFTKEDWKEIANLVVDDAVLIDEQTYTENVFLLYADYINASANTITSFITQEKTDSINNLADEIRVKTDSLQNGLITEVEYVETCLWISLEAMIKLISATVGTYTNPEIANLIDGISTYSFEYGRLLLYRKEQAIINEYIENQYILDAKLQARYEEFVNELNKQSEKFTLLVNNAFAKDFREALKGSIELAMESGVKEEEILTSIEKIDDFFLN